MAAAVIAILRLFYSAASAYVNNQAARRQLHWLFPQLVTCGRLIMGVGGVRSVIGEVRGSLSRDTAVGPEAPPHFKRAC
eukprot:scaffold103128_cov31-Tisochrysis_lutea.AAC.6